MIIYKCVVSDDEIISDINNIIDVGDGLWEINGKMIKVGNEDIVLDGANPSAEGEDGDEGDAADDQVPVLNLANQFRWSKLEGGMEKKAYQAELKIYAKNVIKALTAKNETDMAAKFKSTAPTAMKKILANWSNYDVYMGESMTEGSMYILVDFREDGLTPYATIWAHALEGMKV